MRTQTSSSPTTHAHHCHSRIRSSTQPITQASTSPRCVGGHYEREPRDQSEVRVALDQPMRRLVCCFKAKAGRLPELSF